MLTIQSIINVALTVLLFVIAPILFAVSGGMILFSGASPSLLQLGRKAFYGTVIGVAIALAAYVIVATFLVLIGANISPTGKGGVAWPTINCDPTLLGPLP